MIVTLDGPAGAGKSTVAKALAGRLGFAFLDTGAMYRAVALAALEAGIDQDDGAALAALAQSCGLEFAADRVLLNGRDVTTAIRSAEVTANIHYGADNPAVREHLVQLQREFAVGRDLVTEGRDQGTVAFPTAECKIFLTASPAARARRRAAELQQRGLAADWRQILAEQEERDRRDATRPVGRLYRAADAVELLTDDLTLEQVVDRLVAIVQGRMAQCQ